MCWLPVPQRKGVHTPAACASLQSAVGLGEGRGQVAAEQVSLSPPLASRCHQLLVLDSQHQTALTGANTWQPQAPFKVYQVPEAYVLVAKNVVLARPGVSLLIKGPDPWHNNEKLLSLSVPMPWQ